MYCNLFEKSARTKKINTFHPNYNHIIFFTADHPMGMFPIPRMDGLAGLNGRGLGSMASAAAAALLASSQASGASPGGDGSGLPEGGAKYSCNRCGRSYQHQATLVRHQRYECGIQASYPCDICNRKFKRRDVLKGHKEKCVNKIQAQAALASMAGAAAAVASGGGTMTPLPLSLSTTFGGTGISGGDTTPTSSPMQTPMAMSPPIIAMSPPPAGDSPPSENSSGFRPELHHTF